MLTRYACYLIAQNGDPRKDQDCFCPNIFCSSDQKTGDSEEQIELRERLFAREISGYHRIELSEIIYERGVDSQGSWENQKQKAIRLYLAVILHYR